MWARTAAPASIGPYDLSHKCLSCPHYPEDRPQPFVNDYHGTGRTCQTALCMGGDSWARRPCRVSRDSRANTRAWGSIGQVRIHWRVVGLPRIQGNFKTAEVRWCSMRLTWRKHSHSDVHAIRGDTPMTTHIAGHEGVGRVVQRE